MVGDHLHVPIEGVIVREHGPTVAIPSGGPCTAALVAAAGGRLVAPDEAPTHLVRTEGTDSSQRRKGCFSNPNSVPLILGGSGFLPEDCDKFGFSQNVTNLRQTILHDG